ncbi:hypothetical protein SSYRP_v1c04540 [Spiroplasma syrphidicola EA-1]|uniref:GmrSD restriction endonucleases N-terminal domain-containing protein n=1 Tax=Spiroplasma syrphidicola EA-1 TaxID=1276229 RepID=R4ULB4_9MOLU|nr:DUF262 domain-containing protein [Spiroplasma syrphidicola]AGM26046.1 hypothetical protein SSYRP_v1c04540 [Spiroplasma syrphidicola EA-1]
MKLVTLDAIIPRDDFETLEEASNNTRNKTTISIEDLKNDSFFFLNLRKPDFQRETNDWSPQKIVGLVESFLKGDLVPAIILWKNKNGLIFVIDGSHRLSSLCAWINDDYGDKDISAKYFDNYIPEEQKKIAEDTRTLMKEKVGLFSDYYKQTGQTHDSKNSNINLYLKNLGSISIQVQWVEGDSDRAEQSFLKINQSASPILPAELELIQSRHTPQSIAARAIYRAGKGHNYWSMFSENTQKLIKDYAEKIHLFLFKTGTVSKSDLSSFAMAGLLSSGDSLGIILQTIKISNALKDNLEYVENKTIDERIIIKYMKNTLKLLEVINSNQKGSLGLHPYVYFYSSNGKHKIGSYYGFLLLVKELNEQNKFPEFIRAREKIELILVKYHFLVQQIIRKNRSTSNSYVNVANWYRLLINEIISNENEEIDNIVKKCIQNNQNFSYLNLAITDNEDNSTRKDFSRGQKNIIKMQTLFDTLPKCKICNGYVDMNSASIDHIKRKADGGEANFNNGQVTHIYCNMSIKK